MSFTQHVKLALFALLYVMADGRRKPSKSAKRNLFLSFLQIVTLLFIIDLGQVIRVLLSPQYGWSKDTYNTAKYIDIVYDIQQLLALLVPRYVFFAFAFLLVSFAITDGLYCAWLFKGGEINNIGPVKVLRFMVAVVVTTLFSSIIKWLLIPLECAAFEDWQREAAEESFSDLFHSAGNCTPFAFPEIIFSIPTILLTVLYAAFALTASFFAIASDSLAAHPISQCTGRVEWQFLMTKLLASFLVFTAQTITPVATNAMLSVACVHLLWRHLQALPFHHFGTNMLRGGVYATLCWLSVCGLLVAIAESSPLAEEYPQQLQRMQWGFLSLLPLAFSSGFWLVHRHRKRHNKAIASLRAEFELSVSEESARAENARAKSVLSPTSSAARSEDPALRSAPPSLQLQPAQSSVQPNVRLAGAEPRALYSVRSDNQNLMPESANGANEPAASRIEHHPFGRGKEECHSFSSWVQAHSVARTLLQRKEEHDLPLLEYMVKRAIKEYPEAAGIKVLWVGLLRFIYGKPQEARAEESALWTSSSGLALDLQYQLYMTERKDYQDLASSMVGTGTSSAIKLMEFEAGFQKAQLAHTHALASLKKFWGDVIRARKHDNDAANVPPMVSHVVACNKAVATASREYSALLEKYPNSMQLLRSFAAYSETVVNDTAQAEELFTKADMLDNGGTGDGMAISEWGGMAHSLHAPSSICTSDRGEKTRRQRETWREEVLQQEKTALARLSLKLRLCFALLLVVSAVGFGIMEVGLFEGRAHKDIHRIRDTGVQRTQTITGAYLLRSVYLAARAGDERGVVELQAKLQSVAAEVQQRHRHNYKNSHIDRAEDYFWAHQVSVSVPTLTGWDQANQSFWTFGNDWTRRMLLAGNLSVDAMNSSDFSLIGMHENGEAKPDVSYMSVNPPLRPMPRRYQNLYRAAIPAMEGIAMVYEEEMSRLWHIAIAAAAMYTAATMVLLLSMAWLLLRSFRLLLHNLHHVDWACLFALQVPATVSLRLRNFYSKVQEERRALEDEEEGRAMLLNDDADDHLGHASPVARRRSSSNDGSPTAVAGNAQQAVLDEGALNRLGEEANRGQAQHEAESAGTSFKKELRFPPSPPPRGVTEADFGVSAMGSRGVRQAGAMRSPRRRSALQGSTGTDPALLASSHHPTGHTDGAANGSDKVGAAGSKALQVRETEEVSTNGEKAGEVVAGDENAPIRHVEIVAGVNLGNAEEVDGEILVKVESGDEDERVAIATEEWGSEDRIWAVGQAVEESVQPPSVAHAKPSLLPLKAAALKGDMAVALERGRASSLASVCESEVEECILEAPLHGNGNTVPAHGGGQVEQRGGDVPGSPPFGTQSRAVTEAASRRPSARSILNVNRAGFHLQRSVSDDTMMHSPDLHRGGSSLSFGRSKPHMFNSFTGRRPEQPSPLRVQMDPAAGGDRPREQSEGRLTREARHLTVFSQQRLAAARAAVQRERAQHQSWWTRLSVHSVLLVVIAGLSLLQTLLPATYIRDLVTLAPTVNQADRREQLLRSCVHLSRELVLDDGLSRMAHPDLTSALHHHLNELRGVTDAIRFGGGFGIDVGADAWSDLHNNVMYGDGCGDAECQVAGQGGLYHSYLSFIEALETVLLRHGAPGPHTDKFEANPPDDIASTQFDTVEHRQERVRLLTSDSQVQAVLEHFDGELFAGFHELVEAFASEMEALIEKAIADSQSLFTVYMLVTFCFGYYLVRAALRDAQAEIEQARTFVLRIPFKALLPQDIQAIDHMLVPADDEHEHDELGRVDSASTLEESPPLSSAMRPSQHVDADENTV